MRHASHLTATIPCLVAMTITTSVLPALSQAPAKDWTTEKCRRYSQLVSQAVAAQGNAGLGATFLASHEAFIASNCTARADVCARSKEELALANTLVMAGMGRGLSSTFFPFYCR